MPELRACSIIAFTGANPVPLATNTTGLVPPLAQEKRPERPLEPQYVLLLHAAEHVLAERAAVVAQVQLEELVAVGRVRHREAAPYAVAHQEVDVLARQELQPLVRGKLEQEPHYVGCHPFELVHAAGQHLDLDVLHAGDLPAFDDRVGQRARLAEERHPGGVLGLRQRVFLVGPVVEGAETIRPLHVPHAPLRHP
jgi:hypothetical protein